MIVTKLYIVIFFMAFGKQPLTTAAALSTTKLPPTRIFCYGDSLTAGTAPLDINLFPYAPHLEAALKEQGRNAIVRHRGLPGWTASEMKNEANVESVGLRPAIKAGMPLELVIIMAGTNDLGYNSDADSIANSIIALHKVCFEENVPRTMAIGIPPSGYQTMVPSAATLAQTINDNLKEYCRSEPRATFIPFPFAFEKEDKKWSFDGLHFTREGYRALGTSLSPVVEEILRK